MRLVPVGRDDEHVQAAGRIRRQGCVTPRSLVLCTFVNGPPLVRNSAPKRRFGGCSRDTATTEARSMDSDRFAESKSTAARQYGSDTFTGSVKILASATKWTTTSRDYCWGPIARCQVGNFMNNFCSPTTQRYRRYPPQRMCSSLTRLSTLDYAHVTAATAVEPAKSAVALSV